MESTKPTIDVNHAFDPELRQAQADMDAYLDSRPFEDAKGKLHDPKTGNFMSAEAAGKVYSDPEKNLDETDAYAAMTPLQLARLSAEAEIRGDRTTMQSIDDALQNALDKMGLDSTNTAYDDKGGKQKGRKSEYETVLDRVLDYREQYRAELTGEQEAHEANLKEEAALNLFANEANPSIDIADAGVIPSDSYPVPGTPQPGETIFDYPDKGETTTTESVPESTATTTTTPTPETTTVTTTAPEVSTTTTTALSLEEAARNIKWADNTFAAPKAEDLKYRAYTDSEGRLLNHTEQANDIMRLVESGDMAGLLEKSGAYLDSAKMDVDGRLNAGEMDESEAKKIIERENDFIERSFAEADPIGTEMLRYLGDLHAKNGSLSPDQEAKYRETAHQVQNKLMASYAELAKLRLEGKLTAEQEKELAGMRDQILDANRKWNIANGSLSDAEVERQNLLMEERLDKVLATGTWITPEAQAAPQKTAAELLKELNAAMEAGDKEEFIRIRSLIMTDATQRAADNPEEADKIISNMQAHMTKVSEYMGAPFMLDVVPAAREVQPAMEKKPRSRARKLGYALVGLAAAGAAAFGIGRALDNGGDESRGNAPVEVPVDTLPEDSVPTATTVPGAETPPSTAPEGDGEEPTTSQPESPDDDRAEEQDNGDNQPGTEDNDQDKNADGESPVADEAATVETPADRGESAAPTTETEPANVDVTDWSWNVAHQLAPGNETAFMQRGIDAYNAQYGTNFALTPHNGSTWIMDGNHAVSPAEMEAMNQLMLADSSDS